jgi:hypothetical protein
VLRKVGVSLLAAFGLAAATAHGQTWADKMFNTLDHDFTTVARGADTVYRFEVTNLYKQDMILMGVRSSCGCTSPSIESAPGVPADSVTLKTHEKAYIAARFNTRTHVGQKGATLTVTFGGSYPAEVQLHVHGYIRSDIVFNPGSIEFGEVNEGEPKDQRVQVMYAGRGDWQITDVTNDNDNFEVELQEAERTAGKVTYNLLVRLKPNVPAGFVKDQLTVITNDSRPENQRIPLIVSGHVRPEFSVQPSMLVLGELPPGAHVTRKIVVRGKDPFKIMDVDCGEDCFDFKKDNDEAKKVHFVEVTFKAGEHPAKIETPIRIKTDRENRGASLVASATVIQAPPAPAQPATPAAGGASAKAPAESGAVRTASSP